MMRQEELITVFQALSPQALQPAEIDALVRAGQCKDGKLCIDAFSVIAGSRMFS